MNETFDAQPAARLLAQCWHSGELIESLPAALRPRDLVEGYDIQDRLADELGLPVAGWKLGVGSALQKRQTGIGRAIAGRILRSVVHGPGDTVAWKGTGPVTVEFEIAYVLGRDVLPDAPPVGPEEVIGETRVAFELVCSRFVDRRAVGWPSFAGDLAGCHALVLGEQLDAAALADLAATLVVSAGGEDRARILTGEDATDPMAALSDLLAIARERGIALPAGSIVSTGTQSKPFDVAAPGALIEARFSGRSLALRLAAGKAH